MRQVAKKGLITAVATGGVLAVTGGYAYADAGAAGTAAGSPGVLSGNTVQVPVHIPINLCGNTIDAVGLLNPSFGNHCGNESQGGTGATGTGGAAAHGASSHSGGVLAGNTAQVPVHVPVNLCGNSVDVIGAVNPAFDNHCANHSHGGTGVTGGSGAVGTSTDSPGVGSGNLIQLPVEAPINACGNTLDVVGLLNPSFGNSCENVSTPNAPVTVRHANPPTKARHARPPMVAEPPALAHTGAEQLGVMSAASAGLLLGGFVLYRRGRKVRV